LQFGGFAEARDMVVGHSCLWVGVVTHGIADVPEV
jgi:hypothetical protein